MKEYVKIQAREKVFFFITKIVFFLAFAQLCCFNSILFSTPFGFAKYISWKQPPPLPHFYLSFESFFSVSRVGFGKKKMRRKKRSFSFSQRMISLSSTKYLFLLTYRYPSLDTLPRQLAAKQSPGSKHTQTIFSKVQKIFKFGYSCSGRSNFNIIRRC